MEQTRSATPRSRPQLRRTGPNPSHSGPAAKPSALVSSVPPKTQVELELDQFELELERRVRKNRGKLMEIIQNSAKLVEILQRASPEVGTRFEFFTLVSNAVQAEEAQIGLRRRFPQRLSRSLDLAMFHRQEIACAPSSSQSRAVPAPQPRRRTSSR